MGAPHALPPEAPTTVHFHVLGQSLSALQVTALTWQCLVVTGGQVQGSGAGGGAVGAGTGAVEPGGVGTSEPDEPALPDEEELLPDVPLPPAGGAVAVLAHAQPPESRTHVNPAAPQSASTLQGKA
jgi:hypothetical protein